MKKTCFVLTLFVLLMPVSAMAASSNKPAEKNLDQPVSNQPDLIPPDQAGSGLGERPAPNNDKTTPAADAAGQTADLLSAETEELPEDNVLENELKYSPLNERARERRSQVATAVEELMNLSKTIDDKTVGEQIRVIAKKQARNQDTINQSIDKIEKRSKVANFFLGPDYKTVREANRKILEDNEQIRNLRSFRDQLASSQDKPPSLSRSQLSRDRIFRSGGR